MDERTRSPFMPYGLSGVMVAAAAVFFAYIGFDSISTHSEEARQPQRDVPIGILASLGLCTLLYFGVSAVITGMEPYPQIDHQRRHRRGVPQTGRVQEQSILLRISACLIATGALAGMTSVLLITFLEPGPHLPGDGPRRAAAAEHLRRRPPRVPHAAHLDDADRRHDHRGRGLHADRVLDEMVNIGTLLAFVIVCAAVAAPRIDGPTPTGRSAARSCTSWRRWASW